MATPQTAVASLRRELGRGDLILFSMAGLIGTRWLALAAHAGPGAITLWGLAAIFFLIPSAYAIARLSARYPEEGGLYVWARESFGEWHGFLCFWIYWLGLAFWFPGALMAVTSVAAYAFGPAFAAYAENRWYVLPVALALLWIAVGANLVGLRVGKWLDNLGGISNYLLGGLLVIMAAVVWTKRGSATPFDFRVQWNWERINFWSQICYALTGLELAPVLGGEIRDPERNLPAASLISSPLVAGFYAIGTLALLVILPADQISPLNGIAQSTAAAAPLIGGSWLTPCVAALIVICGVGQFSVLGSVAARLPFVVGADAYMPAALARVHPRWHTPHVSILLFGGIASAFLVIVQLGETARAAYQIINDLMVIAGFIPFGYIFLSAWKCGCRLSVISGLGVTALALTFAIIPTADVRSVWLFEGKLFGVTALLILTARLVFVRYRKLRREAVQQAAPRPHLMQ